jgi:Arrestin (or S-antigen), C-terminal domain
MESFQRNAVRMNIRVIQEQIAENLKEHLAVMPLSRPATMVGRQFFLSPGRIQIEMCLDKAVTYYGDRIAISVSITNSSNRTIRKIKVKLSGGDIVTR